MLILACFCVVTPLEMIKVRQQTDLMQGGQRKYHGLLRTASLIVREEG